MGRRGYHNLVTLLLPLPTERRWSERPDDGATANISQPNQSAIADSDYIVLDGNHECISIIKEQKT